MVETRRWHRTQAERSADTQAALLDATIACLAEMGYSRTSTTAIVRRAGVSRGAQVHHYPTKADLVLAAVERVFGQQEQLFADRFLALPESERTLQRAIDLLWSVFDGPVYPAILELIVAARTDPELKVVVQAVGPRFERTVSRLFAEFFPELRDLPLGGNLTAFAFAVLQGAALAGYSGFGNPDEVVSVLRTLSLLATPELLPLLDLLTPEDGDGPAGRPRPGGASD